MTPTSIQDGLTLLAARACAAGGVVEVSLLKTTQSVVRGYFADPGQVAPALKALKASALRPEGVYITLGAVRPDLLARCGNRFEPWAKTRVADADVTRRLWVPIDCDPARPAGISATEDELQAAIRRCDEVVTWLQAEHDWPAPVRGSGGNSGHALFAVDLPNDVASTTLIRQILDVLHRKFSDPAVAVDTSVHNAARIWTLYGTHKRKGDDTPDRPHRRSWITSQPDPLVTVTVAQLERVAALARTQSRGAPSAPDADHSDVLDMRAAFEAREWYRRALSDGKHAVTCPWEADHTSQSGVTETCLFEPREPGGLWGFKCQHAHCAGRTIKDVWRLVRPRPQPDEPPAPAPDRPPVTPYTLDDVDVVFRRWLGNEYDIDALHVVLAATAAERLPGDPLWLLIISGSGNAKTETAQALAGAGALVTSTISSEGALLSATSRRERTKDSTGGLLRRLGDRGVLVIKDVTSILSMNREARGILLAAFRELHDGRWERNVGTDGGKTLTWTGRLVVIGAVTTAWDKAHDVIASMGDRFVIVRMDSTQGRMLAGRHACKNTGEEVQMRAELATAVAGVLAGVAPQHAITVTAAETERLLEAANVVTLSRTGVEYDYRGDVIDSHAPEMPTRFAKQLLQLVRGAVAIGLDRSEALRLAIRCARDSMPPLRLAILDDVAAHPDTKTVDVRRRLEKPRATVDRQLQALHMLNVLACEEEEGEHRGQPVMRWRYRLAPGIDPHVLDPDSVPDLSSQQQSTNRRRENDRQEPKVSTPTDLSGTEDEAVPDWVTATDAPLNADESDAPVAAHDVEPAPTCCLDGGTLWLRCKGCVAVPESVRAQAPSTVRAVNGKPHSARG